MTEQVGQEERKEDMLTTTLNDLRAAASDALRSHDKLLEIWRHVDESKLARDATAGDIEILRDLIIRRIYPVNAFCLLVQIDRDGAIEILLSRYLGTAVDPDTKFGGFEFELAAMLDDLQEVGGVECLERLIKHPTFSIGRIADPRVRRVFSDVLHIDEAQVNAWVQSHSDPAGESKGMGPGMGPTLDT